MSFAILSTSVTRFAICARVKPSGKMIRIVGFAGIVEAVDVGGGGSSLPRAFEIPNATPATAANATNTPTITAKTLCFGLGRSARCFT